MRVLEEYLDFVEDTEPPVQFHRWSFLTGVAAMLSRRVYIPFGHDFIYPNMYVMLVGAPGTKKSSAIKIAKKLIDDTDFSAFSFTKTSKQKFLLDWAERAALGMSRKLSDWLDHPIDSSDIPAEMFCCLDEFIDFIGVNNFEFLSLLTTLWDNLPKYDERLKNSESVTIHQPTVNLLGGITPTSLAMALPAESQGQGFFSRIIMVHSEASGKKITFPKIPDPIERMKFVRFFERMREFSGEMLLSPDAKDAIDKIYKKWENNIDVKLEYYASRRLIHLLKLIMVLAALEFKNLVERDHVVQANTILCYTEKSMAKALSEFGSARNLPGVSKVMEVVVNSRHPVSPQEIWKQSMSYFDKMSDMVQVLQNLQQAGKIATTEDHKISATVLQPINFGDLVDYGQYIREHKLEDTVHLVHAST